MEKPLKGQVAPNLVESRCVFTMGWLSPQKNTYPVPGTGTAEESQV